MSKQFNGLDIENMFAEAVEASENTGEKDPSLYGKNPTKDKKAETKVDVETKVDKVEPEPKIEIETPTEKTPTKIIEKTNPVIPIPTNNINVSSIQNIIEMKEVLDSYTDRERAFINSYFQQELGSYADVIYSALTTDQRDLEAISKIVKAREQQSAERAFYLMELDNRDIKDIYEQINLLSGQLDDINEINDHNKIKVCRVLENVISEMDKNVFLYIHKLQEFTSKSLN